MEDNRKNLIKLGLYFGALVVLIIVLKLSGGSVNTNVNNSDMNTPKEETILSTIEKINSKYYKSKVYITLDDDAQTIEYEKKDNILVGNKKYHQESINFIEYNDNYYTYNEDRISRLYDFSYFDYDKTFIDLNNFKSLIKLDSVNKEYSLNDNKVLELTFDIRDVLKLYNNINNTNYITLDKQEINLKIYSKNNKIEYMLLELTELYNFINNSKFEEVNYKLTFEETKKEDTSWLIERLN